jgi:hypothetical protein
MLLLLVDVTMVLKVVGNIHVFVQLVNVLFGQTLSTVKFVSLLVSVPAIIQIVPPHKYVILHRDKLSVLVVH